MSDSAAQPNHGSAPAPSRSITFPEHLPVSARRDDIIAALAEHQVIIVAGETGSGKTTQLPKMCLALGLDEHGIIGHTQPRRIAARSVAERIAEELGEDIGSTVGYQVRFTAETSEDTRVKVMTDGILLAEIPHDPLLKRYSVIIIDEAHERSLNIDFLLGYLKRILPQRPDLKVIVTSATIDPESFAAHFATGVDAEGEPEPAPIIEVSGRTFPVEIRYRPLTESDSPHGDDDAAERGGGHDEESRDPVDAVGDAVEELAAEPDGDILVFFPGEREIRDAAEALAPRLAAHPRLSTTEILPLYGRLSMAEQHRVFRRGGKRRIVLATNVAETSLTVPGIKYVVDTGTARISRYSHRTKVQRLPIERISQASAAQRSGRSGRTSDGIAIRLYSQEDFEARAEFTDPEILRTNLAAVILQMLHLGVAKTPKDIADFPFLQPPDTRQITDGATLLTELGALNSGAPGSGSQGTITSLGRSLARLPVDPRLGRMILAAHELGCTREVMILAAALTIQDPRERPTEHRAQADELHARFRDDASDFSSVLNLWSYLRTQQKELSGNQFRKMCRAEFINYLRVREWQDLVQQLRQLASQIGIKVSPGPLDAVAMHEPVHRALLTGLLSHIGSWDERKREYQGARGTRFAVFPGSGLFKKRHAFVMAAELVETSRLWARMVAAIEPEWIEQAAGSLAKHSYSEPHWSRRQGAAMARERVTVLGVTIAVDRLVRFSRVDRTEARAMFIQHALVEGDWQSRHHFVARNEQALREVEELETRLRRRDLRISDEDLFRFYDERVPASVVSQRHFDSWWKKERHRNPELLDLDPKALIQAEPEDLDTDLFPTVFTHPTGSGDVELALDYAFNPSVTTEGSGTDGVTVTIPVVLLNQMDPQRFAWLIPGLRVELVTALIRALPKAVRKQVVPAPDVAARAVAILDAEFDPAHDELLASLSTVLRRLKSVVISEDQWNPAAVPEHLRMTYRVVDDRSAVVGVGENLEDLQARLSSANRTAIAASLAEAGLATRDGTRGPAQSSAPRPTPGAAAQRGAQKRSKGNTNSRADAPAYTPRHGLTSWDVGDLSRSVKTSVPAGSGSQEITGYPALRAETLEDGSPAAGLIITRTTGEQRQVHRRGVTALLRATVPNPQRYVLDHLNHQEKLTFSQSPHSSIDSLIADCTTAAIDALLPADDALPFTERDFSALGEQVRAELIEKVFAVTRVVEQSLRLAAQVRKRVKATRSLSLAAAVSDLRAQVDQLIYPGFVAETGWRHLQHLPRYLQAMLTRLDRLDAGGQLQRDGLNMQVVQGLEDQFDDAVAAVPESIPVPNELAEVRWLIEELRVSFFAQDLGTAVSVSEKRVRQALQGARRS
ncbi:ATP-dependent RNA helicase HrpA [Citricoccus sp. NR2]|uniref:ATP-dependent RNA helicase HrpA n=1 Tax=Citricoccus sp. NR2 TaxID=3004095 RepID=UPI0022DD0DB6|nr:ATP-dependent RNA helicase HrpA [Citricoccus sp. NR2]WBL18652.1 ATP-dependent RNA helicase HrpA [Citricoccus sp. NR2]